MTAFSIRHLSARAATLALAACAQAPAPTLLPAGVADARFVLLGEVRHHTLRAQWLQALLADGRPTRIVFEQMDATRDAELQAARAATPTDSAAITRAGGLDAKAWRWPLHQPLVDAALAGRAGIAGGNLPRDTIRAVVREGTVPPNLKPLLDAPGWTPEQQRATEADIAQGHCGALPAKQIAPMSLAQRVRDASLAQAMLAAPAGERVVLIAGNGHVRRDRGVPHYLRAAGVPASAILSVGLVEVDGEGDGTSLGAYDRLQATARQPRPDPCDAFKVRG
jgi:uncharacterized iron-regulated protein